MTLPEEFIAYYTDLLADDADAFLSSFNAPAQSGFRVNPLKGISMTFEDPIPSMPLSYYGKYAGKSWEHATGLIYSQEPAAQIVGMVAAPQQGEKVLDLCAAPGGKSTHLLSYLEGTGLLVTNDISAKRSKILSENIERFGARNAIVTNSSPERLAKHFKGYFDTIVCDVPCSGEGMFRKDADAVRYWHKAYAAECAILQKEILDSAVSMLAPEGTLVYSTCTWSYEENEAIVDWLLYTYDLELVTIPKTNGMQEGISHPEVARMYPHQFRGEGQFVAKFRASKDMTSTTINPATPQLSNAQQKLWKAFEKETLTNPLMGVIQAYGNHLYLLPEGAPDMAGIRVVRNGLYLGECKKNRFEPSFSLGMALLPGEVISHVTLDDADFKRYMMGEAVTLTGSGESGWVQVVVHGCGLGFAKRVGNTLKNHYPKGLRWRNAH